MAYDVRFSSFALLGSGQIARHFQHYLKLLQAPVSFWSRNGDEQFNTFSDSSPTLRLQKTISEASHILLAVRDDAIEELAGRLPASKTLVHFSGVANVTGVLACHPLQTFTGPPRALEWYESIPFVIDQNTDFQKLMPGLKNACYAINPEQRPLYHALCSLAGNSTFLIWNKIGEEFENKLGLQRKILEPFLHAAVTNALSSSGPGFAGPVARHDWDTVMTHLLSLRENKNLLGAYRSYLNLAARSGAPVPEALL